MHSTPVAGRAKAGCFVRRLLPPPICAGRHEASDHRAPMRGAQIHSKLAGARIRGHRGGKARSRRENLCSSKAYRSGRGRLPGLHLPSPGGSLQIPRAVRLRSRQSASQTAQRCPEDPQAGIIKVAWGTCPKRRFPTARRLEMRGAFKALTYALPPFRKRLDCTSVVDALLFGCRL